MTIIDVQSNKNNIKNNLYLSLNNRSKHSLNMFHIVILKQMKDSSHETDKQQHIKL